MFTSTSSIEAGQTSNRMWISCFKNAIKFQTENICSLDNTTRWSCRSASEAPGELLYVKFEREFELLVASSRSFSTFFFRVSQIPQVCKPLSSFDHQKYLCIQLPEKYFFMKNCRANAYRNRMFEFFVPMHVRRSSRLFERE